MKPVTMQKKASTKKAARTKKTTLPNPCATASSVSATGTLTSEKTDAPSSKVPSQPTSVEKTSPSHTAFPHISEKSVKCYWEQYHDGDIEIAPDVYNFVAESASFKLWELLNNLKTYTRHCGGKLSTELLDSAFSDSDIPPSIGANSDTGWESMDADGLHFFNSDYVFHLHDEFMKPVDLGKLSPISLQISVFAEQQSLKDLERFCIYLCNSVLIGDQICYDAAISIAFSNPFIGSMLKPMLLKCIQMIAFDYKPITLQRILKLLSAVARNPSCNNIDATQQFHHLANLFECLLLGPSFISDKHKSEVAECIINLTNEPMQTETKNGAKVVKIKQEFEDDVHMEISSETKEINDVSECNGSVSNSSTDEKKHSEPIFEGLTTVMCDESNLDGVVQTMATIASVWGFFEDRIIENLNIRINDFFRNVNDWNNRDYDYLKRLVQGILALGDFAFREILEHLEVINISKMTVSLIVELNLSGIYIRGRTDIFIYEWLNEVCGDGLQPFMLYYSKYILNYWKRSRKSKKEFKVKVKYLLKTRPLNEPAAKLAPSVWFPDLIQPKPPPKQIAFRFPGCRPAPAKSRKREICKEVLPTVQNLEYLSNFNSKIVVCKRRLKKPSLNRKTPPRVLTNIELIPF